MSSERDWSVDKDDNSSTGTLPSNPSQDDTLPITVAAPEDEQFLDESDRESSSTVNSEIWMPMDENARKGAHAMMLFRGGMAPQDVLSALFPDISLPYPRISDGAAFRLLTNLCDQPPRRTKLPSINSFSDAVRLFRSSKKILILTGAGVSVSCGIPDFRSKDGIYARLHELFPDLPDPTAMFDMEYFQRNPKPFYDFAKDLFPGAFEPSFSHKFIAQLEKKEKLLRNYTQNIDTLEKVAGIERVVECHGSFSSATCLQCKAKYTPDDIRDCVMEKRVAMCSSCGTGVIKPDIVFFGEDLHSDFHQQMALDKNQPDLLVVIGSSLKVRPVSLIPFAVPPSCPQILINREPISHYTADIELLGNCDDILREIALEMGEYDLVEKQDAAQGKNVLESRRRRRQIPRAEFMQMIREHYRLDEEEDEEVGESSRSNEEEQNGEIDAEGDEVPTKKRKVEQEGEGEEDLSMLRKLQSMYSTRFISVVSHIKEYAFIQVGGHQCVFPGAELYMDLDSGCLTHIPRRMAAAADSSDEDEEEDEEECHLHESDDMMFTRSVDAAGLIPSPDWLSLPERAMSCEAVIDTETRTPLSSILAPFCVSDEDEEEDDNEEQEEEEEEEGEEPAE